MKESVYIFTNGKLSRKNNTICFENKEGKEEFLPVENIEQIYVFGDVDLNARILTFLSSKKIILHYFNYFGYYTGSFYPREHNNSGLIIVEQSRHYLDEGKRLFLAKKFVAGASKNMIKVLSYYLKRGKKVRKEMEILKSKLKSVQKAKTVSNLMAFEGMAKETYYRAFDKIINSTDFSFNLRTRRPPRNRLNALISFSNSIIYTTVLSEIYKTHLDPRIGYLHASNFRKFSLNLDIAEIFKPIIGDRTIFACINKKIITEKDFEEKFGGILLNKSGKKKFLKQFDEKLKTTVMHYGLNRKVSYKTLIRLEVYKIEKHLLGEKEYKPFTAGW